MLIDGEKFKQALRKGAEKVKVYKCDYCDSETMPCVLIVNDEADQPDYCPYDAMCGEFHFLASSTFDLESWRGDLVRELTEWKANEQRSLGDYATMVGFLYGKLYRLWEEHLRILGENLIDKEEMDHE